MRKVNYKEKGITLIALVVTIIILLILAGVTLTTALSQNGLFQRAKIAGENYKKAEADETEKLGEVEKEIDKIVDEQSKTPLQKDATLNVELKVNEAKVNGTTIPVTVGKIIKGEDELQKENEKLTYTWYTTGGEESSGEDSYEFKNLDQAKSYTLNCKVVKDNGEWGIGEVKVISFKIGDKFYRATDGMTWQDLMDSEYDTSAPNIVVENGKYGSHTNEHSWGKLRKIWDGRVGFPCENCGTFYHDGVIEEPRMKAMVEDNTAYYEDEVNDGYEYSVDDCVLYD